MFKTMSILAALVMTVLLLRTVYAGFSGEEQSTSEELLAQKHHTIAQVVAKPKKVASRYRPYEAMKFPLRSPKRPVRNIYRSGYSSGYRSTSSRSVRNRSIHRSRSYSSRSYGGWGK